MDLQWWAEVTEWIAQITGAPVELNETRERVWGVVAYVTTPQGALYFKAPGVLAHHETRLLVDLSPAWSGLVPDVVAADQTRGWVLTADHGVPMGAVLEPADQFAVLERILPVYGAMQVATVQFVRGWVDAGLPDRSVAALPDLVARLLGNRALRIDTEERHAYEASLPELTRVCAALAATPMAAAIDHCDIHEGNVLVDGAEARLIDWGDACATHPFTSLFLPFQFVVGSLGDDRRAKALRLRDMYLEAWGLGADLRETFRLAIAVAPLVRALSVAHHTVNASGSWAEDDREEITMLFRAWWAQNTPFETDDLLFAGLYD